MALSFLNIGMLQNIDNNLGLYLLLGIIPLIILYLIKPKPDEKTIPSLMFLINNFQREKKYSFLRRFVREFLFLLQLLIIILIAVSASHPFMKTDKAIDAEFTVLVLDISASSQVDEGFSTRFSRMIDKAKDNLDGKISIILVMNNPYIALNEGDKTEAVDILSLLEPTDSLSSLGTSILAADDLLKDKDGKVVVISDFVHTDGVDPWVAKKTLESKGIMVEFIDVSDEDENIGIVDLEGSDYEVKVTIKNYNNDTEKISLSINDETQSVEIPPNDVEIINFEPNGGINNIDILTEDAFDLDNHVHVSMPEEKITDILLISNNEMNYVLPVLEAYSDVWNDNANFETGTPPVLPVINHDVIIVNDIIDDKFPSSGYKRIKSLVDEGAILILYAQEDLENLDFDDLLPVSLGKLQNNETVAYNTYKISDVTTEVNFGTTSKYFSATANEDTIVLAESDDDDPLVAIMPYGEGKVVYIGLMEEYSTFKYDVSYPIFWQQLIDYVIGKDSFETLNHEIGELIIFDSNIKVKTPSKVFRTEELDLDEVGVYEYQDRKVAVNLLSRVESQISFEENILSDSSLAMQGSLIEVKMSLTKYFIYGFLLLLFGELFYIKFRGDL